jgi:hypothetical protein
MTTIVLNSWAPANMLQHDYYKLYRIHDSRFTLPVYYYLTALRQEYEGTACPGPVWPVTSV